MLTTNEYINEMETKRQSVSKNLEDLREVMLFRGMTTSELEAFDMLMKKYIYAK